MSNKPQIKIKGKVQDMNKKEKNVKPKHSNFLLTINTNQQYKDNDEHLGDDIEIFDHSIKTILNNIDQYINLPETDKWDDDTIKMLMSTMLSNVVVKKDNYTFIYYLNSNIIHVFN